VTQLISSKRHLIDKSKWPDGPWKDEPDLAEWNDKETGYRCVICRQPSGYLCGYVGVDKGHQLWKQTYNDMNFFCHGGVTYSGLIENIMEEIDANKGLWFIGFDCGHFYDVRPLVNFKISPDLLELLSGSETKIKYREWGYVEEEVRGLAKQIKKYHDDMSLGS